jgi:hypothetical protein
MILKCNLNKWELRWLSQYSDGRGSVPGTNKELFYTPHHLSRDWNSQCLRFNGCQGLVPWCKVAETWSSSHTSNCTHFSFAEQWVNGGSSSLKGLTTFSSGRCFFVAYVLNPHRAMEAVVRRRPLTSMWCQDQERWSHKSTPPIRLQERYLIISALKTQWLLHTWTISFNILKLFIRPTHVPYTSIIFFLASCCTVLFNNFLG